MLWLLVECDHLTRTFELMQNCKKTGKSFGGRLMTNKALTGLVVLLRDEGGSVLLLH